MIEKQYIGNSIGKGMDAFNKQDNASQGYNPYRNKDGTFASGPSTAFGKYGTAKDVHPNDAGLAPNISTSDGDSVRYTITSAMDAKSLDATIMTGAATQKAINDKMDTSDMFSSREAYELQDGATKLNETANNIVRHIANAGALAGHSRGFNMDIDFALSYAKRSQLEFERDAAAVERRLKDVRVPEHIRANAQAKYNVAIAATNTMNNIQKNTDFSGNTSYTTDVTDRVTRR